ncbi:MAG: hypothetical protein GC160_24595 [Acidobacteria bacterium]|nr:hypothetical protein [Acidobacteriota bacterium]
MATPGFGELASRLVRYLNELVRRGEISERGLARLAGYSQPHVHNVLHGRRALNLEVADRFLETLGISLTALFTPDEMAGAPPAGLSGARPVPLLQGPLGGGQPFPREAAYPAVELLPARAVGDSVNPTAALVSPDERTAWPALWPGDLVLLDRSPHLRRRPQLESFYAIAWRDVGYICRCHRIGDGLLTVVDSDGSPAPPPRLTVDPGELLQVIRGKIVWAGRDLRSAP